MTIEEVMDAIKNGTLPEGYTITVDNDAVYMYGPGEDGARLSRFEGQCPEQVLVEVLQHLNANAGRA